MTPPAPLSAASTAAAATVPTPSLLCLRVIELLPENDVGMTFADVERLDELKS